MGLDSGGRHLGDRLRHYGCAAGGATAAVGGDVEGSSCGAALVGEVLVGDAGFDDVVRLGAAAEAVVEAVVAVGEADVAARVAGPRLWVGHWREMLELF